MSVEARSPEPPTYQGRPASPGVTFGPVVVERAATGSGRGAGDPAGERAALETALAGAAAALAGLVAGSSADAAEILEFQLALVEDEALSAPAFEAIDAGQPAEAAWRQALDAQIADYRAAEEEYFRARAADLVDLRDRVAGLLGGQTVAGVELPDGAVYLADDIAPSRFLSTDWRGRGIALQAGSPTSHVAMLARARGIPMIVGLGTVSVDEGDLVLLDADSGRLVVAAEPADQLRFAAEFAIHRRRAPATLETATGPALTADGERVAILINVADPSELSDVPVAICDGIGLARTELMFNAPGAAGIGTSGGTGTGGGAGLADEETQLSAYRRLLAWADGRPVTVRTLDAGGDKPIAGYTVPNEANSFLGMRGVRLSLKHPDIFRVQIRALLRAAAEGEIRVMVPMVSVPSEMRQVREMVAAAAGELAAEGLAHKVPPVGMMVEVPAAALVLEAFDTDFVSIGSNDLTQYVMAASRDSADLHDLADPADPAVLALIATIVDKAGRRAVPVSICGDAGGDPAIVPALLDAGLRTLSVAPAAVGRVRRAVNDYRSAAA
ncbi:phosphoenolpyruvate--protein phosphotransferase [Microbaculum marinum]|uniref:Phosphoenolpyruvate-protein phosphotransferase n=1 Tax=Microbaculum marinum TaxID=1764581 RepID=A0AAW9R9V2_9HYPH